MSVLALFSTVALVTLVCVRRIPEGQAYTLRRIGGHCRTVGAGVHLVFPGIERIAHKIQLLGNIVEVKGLPGPSGTAPVQGKVYFQVLDAARADAFIERIGEMVLQHVPELLDEAENEDAAARNLRVKCGLNLQLRESGILVTRVQLA